VIDFSRKTLLQFMKYNVGGLLYFWSAWSIITFLSPKFGLFWMNIVGNTIGIVLNYLVQRFWAFDAGPSSKKSSWKFIALTLFNLMLSYFILKGLVYLGVPLWLAQFVSAGLFMGWNYFMYKLWVFKA
jgi:putative flippase GtrA